MPCRFEARHREEAGGSDATSVLPGVAGIEMTDAGAAAEMRRRYAKQDLRCPITLEVMRDPVMAADGHSYEREAILRWLRGHRTSPLTGRKAPTRCTGTAWTCTARGHGHVPRHLCHPWPSAVRVTNDRTPNPLAPSQGASSRLRS